MKKNILGFLLILTSFWGFGQTLYVKLKQPIENSQPLLDKVNAQYSVSFVKNEKTSRLLDAPVYQIRHGLNEVDVKQLAVQLGGYYRVTDWLEAGIGGRFNSIKGEVEIAPGVAAHVGGGRVPVEPAALRVV